MVRYRYNAQMDPPAPFVHVAVRNREFDNVVPDLPAQLDTGAVFTVLPGHVVEDQRLLPLEEIHVAGFGGHFEKYPTYLVDIVVRDLAGVSVRALSRKDEPYILLGRDVLNQFRVVMDGPQQLLDVE